MYDMELPQNFQMPEGLDECQTEVLDPKIVCVAALSISPGLRDRRSGITRLQ
jgi:hypothetical protein